MSKNIIFVLDFIINSEKLSTDSFFISLFSWNGMGTKDCGWLKVMEDTSHASFKLSWMKDAKRRLSSKDPSDWDGLQRRLVTWQPRNAAFVGCSLPFEKHPISTCNIEKCDEKKTKIKCIYKKINALPKSLKRRQNIFPKSRIFCQCCQLLSNESC